MTPKALKKEDGDLKCPKCGYIEGQKVTETKKNIDEEDPDFSLLAFEGDEGEDTNPTIKLICEKCGHDEAVWWMFQTRSADEPSTSFFKCTKCKFTWREY